MGVAVTLRRRRRSGAGPQLTTNRVMCRTDRMSSGEADDHVTVYGLDAPLTMMTWRRSDSMSIHEPIGNGVVEPMFYVAASEIGISVVTVAVCGVFCRTASFGSIHRRSDARIGDGSLSASRWSYQG
jgi:hypothetical protein